MKNLFGRATTFLLFISAFIGCVEKQVIVEKSIQTSLRSDQKAFPKSIITEGLKEKAQNSEFLFIVSSLGSPRDIASQRLGLQSVPRIVKFRFEREGLKVYRDEQDERFADNILNQDPILTIPAHYADLECSSAKGKECKGQSIVANEKNWDQKTHFVPNFDQLTLTHLSEFDILSEDNCFGPVSQKAFYVELTENVLNVGMEREYKLIGSGDCLTRHYDIKSERIKNPSFKVRHFYSIVRLSELASTDYRAVEYPLEDHSHFGFSKTHKRFLGDHFDLTRQKETYYLNRFNPGKDVARDVHFHLSRTFNLPKNLYLKKASYEVIEKINKALSKAQAGIKINLVPSEGEASEKYSGDLRYNTITLVDGPTADGILGYGPIVANPRTGEILQARTSIYLGGLKSAVRRTYQGMIRASSKGFMAKREEGAGEHRRVLNADIAANTRRATVILGSLEDADEKNGFFGQTDEDIKRRSNDWMFRHLNGKDEQKAGSSHLGVNHESLFEEGRSIHSSARDLIDFHSRNHIYRVEMVHLQGLGLESMPEIEKAPEILGEDGVLKPWEKLNGKQKAWITEVITRNLYMDSLAHELGHNLGLRHNFMGSADASNFYEDGEEEGLSSKNIPKSSSRMDYFSGTSLSNLYAFGKYDIAALRYAYKREVEVAETGEMVGIETTLGHLKEKMASEGKTLKPYLFCTDEQVGTTVFCHRFDQGSTLTEIANFYVNRYREGYEERNWRNGRTDFTSHQLPKYISKTMNLFKSMRSIYEVYELYGDILGKEFIELGCPKEQAKRYAESCEIVNDTREATLTIGNFFLDLLKTPDHTCALSFFTGGKKEGKTAAFVPLRGIYEGMKMAGYGDDVPKSCFDPSVQSYLASPFENHYRESFRVKGESGKYLNSIRDPEPALRGSANLAVRGIWADKILAMRYLLTHINEYSGMATRGNLTSIQAIKNQLDNFLAHIVSRDVLISPYPFQTMEGSKYEEKYFGLSGTNYRIHSSGSSPIVAKFFGLSSLANIPLNKALITNAAWFASLGASETGPIASFLDSISILKVRRTTPMALKGEKEFIIGKNKYIVEKENQLALALTQAKDAFEKLNGISEETISKTLVARMTLPEGLDSDSIMVLKSLSKEEVEGLIEIFPSLDLRMISESEDWPDDFQSAFRLGVKGLKNVLKVFAQMNTPPMGASDDVRMVYTVPLPFVIEFIEGHLERRIEGFEQSIGLLYSQQF
ncbi:MAG: zinc-dependent metalloprotease [Bacteriovoracales bacterium]|nr:zinc-dependent metalloprotease [Bacteriovoracales bacterium]